MLSAYPACFFKEENSYTVIFPDLNHLATCGETLDEALSMAVDCLAGYLYWLKQDGEAAPQPSTMEKISPADIAAMDQDINFSQVLQDALKTKLHVG